MVDFSVTVIFGVGHIMKCVMDTNVVWMDLMK